MNETLPNRRDFLRGAIITAAALPLLASCRTSTLAQKTDTGILKLIKRNANTSPAVNWCGAIDAPDDVTWRTTIPPMADRDLIMTIGGTVYEPDGKTPAPNVLIYFYHTDSEGYYGRGNGEPRHGHFRGWLLTDEQGRYEFTSIKPAAYPNRRFAAHIHMTITTIDRHEDSIGSMVFEGDPFLTASDRDPDKGYYSPVVDLVRGDDGVLRATRNIRLPKI